MNLVSRTVTGIVLLAFGVVMTLLGLFFFVTLPYGIIAIVLGVFIMLNKDEDKIEAIKKTKGGRK